MEQQRLFATTTEPAPRAHAHNKRSSHREKAMHAAVKEGPSPQLEEALAQQGRRSTKKKQASLTSADLSEM